MTAVSQAVYDWIVENYPDYKPSTSEDTACAIAISTAIVHMNDVRVSIISAFPTFKAVVPYSDPELYQTLKKHLDFIVSGRW